MSNHPETSAASSSSTELANMGAQLSEVLSRFNEMNEQIMAQRRVIDQLIAGGNAPQPESTTSGQTEPPPIYPLYGQNPITSQTINPLEEPFPPPPHGPPPTFQMNPPYIQFPHNFPPFSVNPPFEPQGPHYYANAEPFTLDTTQGKAEIGGSSATMDKELIKRLDRFEKFIRKSQGLSKQGELDYNELCLFPEMQLPMGFKAPKFSKYDGNGNPKTHLRLFANKLGRPVDDENLPVRLFPESLEGDALEWYSNLKPEDMKSWIDLSTAFVRQYEYNCELAPTRTTLEGTKRKPSEDHKSYAKRWRTLAAKVEPPMTEKEIVQTFVKAHDPPYFEEIFRMTGCSFAEIVNKLEEYDEFVREGKIVNVYTLKSQLEAMKSQVSSEKKDQFKRKDEETSFVGNQGISIRPRFQRYPTSCPYYSHPRPARHASTNPSRPRPTFKSRPNYQTYNPAQTNASQNPNRYRTFTDLGRPIDQLYEQLKAAGKIGVLPPQAYPRGKPANFDSQAFCAYHSDNPGHSTTDCRALKHKIQDMIDAGYIIMGQEGEQGPNIDKNPFPEQTNSKV